MPLHAATIAPTIRPGTPLAEGVASGAGPFIVLGAIAWG
jgi:hypothetical protein